jgi:putative nucleotidyltransferase with HDIG domain
MKTFRTELRGRLREDDDLPTLPDLITRLRNAVSDGVSNAGSIAGIISRDPSMTGNILRLANSAYYSAGGKPVSTVSDAIVRLGVNETLRICTALEVISSFGTLGGYTDHRKFWIHSITTSTIAGAVKSECGCSIACDDNEIQLAGLLHDVGVLVMDHYFHERSVGIWNESREKNVPTFINEAEHLGMDHGEIGGVAVRKWNLPAPLVSAITYHHQPSREDDEFIGGARVIHVADRICSSKDVGGRRNDIEIDGLTREVLDALEIEEEKIPVLREMARKEIERSDLFVSLSSGAG